MTRVGEQESRRRAFTVVALAGMNLLLATSIAFAAPGDLDSTFGVGGIVTTDFAVSGVTNDAAFALARQADGKLVAAGSTVTDYNRQFGLARYNPDGTLDATFGSAGKVVTDFAAGNDEARGLVIQPDGKLVAAGYATIGSFPAFALARYTADGTLDPTFGIGGKVTTPFAIGYSSAAAIVLQPNGKLLAAGSSGSLNNARFTMVRYNPNGSLDTTFGTGGAAITNFGPGNDRITSLVLVLATPPKIVAAGFAAGIGGSDFALARYTAAGVLDPTFGIGGKVTTDFALGSDTAYALVLQPTTGKLVAGGKAGAGNFALAQYTPNGVLDVTFGTAGKVTTDFSGLDQAEALLVQNGMLLAAGRTEVFGDSHWALARYTVGGALDTTFGTGGKVTTTMGDVAAGPTGAHALLFADGKAVAAGTVFTNYTPSAGIGDFGLARYLF